MNKEIQDRLNKIKQGNIPIGWQKFNLKDLFIIKNGKDHSKLEEGKYPVYGSGGIMRYVNKYLYDKESVLLPRKGTLNNIQYTNTPFWTVDTCYYTEIFTDKVIPYFLYCVLSRIDINRLNTGSTVPSMTNSEYYTISINLPSIEEQRRIADILGECDKLIDLKQKLIESEKQKKKYLMSKLLNPNSDFRLPGFTEPWKKVILGNIGICTGGTSIEKYINTDGDYKVISIGSYSLDSKYTDQGLRVNNNQYISNRILNKNDLTMILNDKTPSGKIIGRVLLIPESNKYVYNQRTERIEPNNKLYDSKFLYYMINESHNRNKIIEIAQGNTQIYVNWNTVAEIEYVIPLIEEQKAIASILSEQDNKIELLENELEQWKLKKKGLMQLLLTGLVRVN